jgi:hypothetical protein
MPRGRWRGTRPGAFGEIIEEAAKDRVKEIAGYALQQVVVSSPVDQGAFKAGHRVSINGDDLSFDPEASDEGGQATISRGRSIIDSITSPFVEVVIQNNAPYAERLESGWSQQAPTGVYANAINSTKERFS